MRRARNPQDGHDGVTALSRCALLTLFVIAGSQAAGAGATLVRRIDTYTAGSFRAEDPSGIAFVPGTGEFFVVDEDIEDSPRFQHVNLWRVRPDGAGVIAGRGIDLTRLTSEPTGLAYHPGRGTLFVTDDDAVEAYEVDLEGHLRNTLDLSNLGARDPEGITYDPVRDSLFVADGRAQQVIELSPDGERRAAWSFKDLGYRDADGIAYEPRSGNLLLVSARSQVLFEMTTAGEWVASYDLSAVGVMYPQGITVAPSSDPSDPEDTESLYVADGMIEHHPDGRILELALVHRPANARLVTSLLGDADGFGFRGTEPGFAPGDANANGVLEAEERLPAVLYEQPARFRDNRDPDDHPATDAMLVVSATRALRFRHVFDLGGQVPIWARLTLLAGDSRTPEGSRNVIRVGDRVIGEVIGSRGKRLHAGPITTTVLELPPDSLAELRDGELEVQIAREPGTGDDDVMIDFMRLEIATERPTEPQPIAMKSGGIER